MVKQKREKQINQFLSETSLDDCFLLGYYGGGNYGDELLFEVLQHIFHARRYTTVNFLYQKSSDYRRFHKELGYQGVDAGNKFHVLTTVLRRKKLVIGGGGLWGLDVNFNVVLMSLLMFIARWFLGKKVYLLGVGYYSSTTILGRLAAWLAGKSAHQILARDIESYENFSRLNQQTYLSDDIAFMLPMIDEDVSYELADFEESVGEPEEQTVMISVRRFKPSQANPYVEALETWLTDHPTAKVILALMEPREVDPEGFALLKCWQHGRDNAVVIDFDYNPLVLHRFFERYHNKLCYVGPQFHVQLVAHLSGVRLLPIVYDNKVAQLLNKLGYENPIAIRNVTAADIENFLDKKGKA